MGKLRVNCFAVSLDGYGAGPDQSLGDPLGAGGTLLHGWSFATRAFQKMFGQGDGETGIDNDLIEKGFDNVGAWILGRNMFSPIRGPWLDDEWKGWWGDEPPYHTPVFVLTHHERAPIAMQGGTTFHFVTGGIDAALKQAQQAAGDKDVRLGGGAATIRQYLSARLIDEMHIAVVPVLLGKGESLFAGLDMLELGYHVADHVQSPRVTHIVLKKIV